MFYMRLVKVLLKLMLLVELTSAFGNEYVHIKVHVPKDQAPSIALDAEPPHHKVIHHFHHHAGPHQSRSRGRGSPSKPKSSPLLESVILSDLDKPLHMSEHADYLNHAKELAEHLSETYVIKKASPPPPPPKKKVNTYTIIEEKHRPIGYDYEPAQENYRPPHHHHQQHLEQDDDDVGYHYPSPARQQRYKSSYGSYAEPAPVEEPPLDLDQNYNYSPPTYASVKSARAPAHTLEAPEESIQDGPYSYSDGSSSSGFRPSPQLLSQPPDNYEDDFDSYAAPVRRRRPAPANWQSRSGFNSAAAPETYNGFESYNMGHIQGLGSAGYSGHSGPYL